MVKVPTCDFNVGVDCPYKGRDCSTCGWCPEVEKQRKAELNPKTQQDRIMRHLRDYGSITATEAVSEYGIVNLSKRIHELREQGHNINRGIEMSRNRYGEWVSIERYTVK